MKKVLSLVLVIAMVLSSMSFAFAGTFTDIADTDYENAIKTLSALGVVTGYEDGTYRPEKTVTRAEMAKLLVEILGYGDLVAGSKSNFADTQGHWADPWIALAAGRGIVVGTGDGKFTPDRTVSYDEAITMVVRALGYTDGCNEIKNMTWPTNFKVKAAELGLTKDVVVSVAGADRGGVAQLLYNALEAVLVTVNSDGDVVKSKNSDTSDTLLLDRLATKMDPYYVTTDKLDKDNKNYAGDKVDLSEYMFQSIVAYVNDDDEVVYVEDTNSLVVEGEIDEVTESSGNTIVAIETASGAIKKVTFVDTESDDDIFAEVFQNGAIKTEEIDFDALEDTETIKIVATDKDGDGKIDATNDDDSEVTGFVLTQQTRVAQIEKEYVEGKTKIDVFSLPEEDDEVDLDNVTVTGAVDSLEDIAEDDIVVEYKADDDSITKLVVSRDTVEGKVTRIDGSSFYIDGTKYSRNDLISTVWSLGDEGTFYLDHNGDIVVFDGASGPTSYAVVVGKAAGEKEESRYEDDEYSIDKYPLIKLATQDDEVISYEVAVEIDTDGSLDSSAKLNSSALLQTSTGASDITFVAGMPANGKIVKYSLDEDGRISKIKTVDQPRISDGTDTEDLVFASNVVIFDANDNDYEVVAEGRLQDTLEDGDDYAVYNDNGEIEVLLTNDVDSSSDTTYAYINKVNPANDGDDDVQLIQVFANGEKVEYYTDSEDLFATSDKGSVLAIGFDGEVITEQDDIDADLVSELTTASAVYTSSGRIVFTDGDGDEVGAYLASDATIITIESDGDVVLADIYDIDEDDSIIDVYMQDGMIAFIVIHE